MCLDERSTQSSPLGYETYTSLTSVGPALLSTYQFTVSSSFNNSAEIADAANYPDIRLMNVALNESTVELQDFSDLILPWSSASPEVRRGCLSISAPRRIKEAVYDGVPFWDDAECGRARVVTFQRGVLLFRSRALQAPEGGYIMCMSIRKRSWDPST